VVDTKKEHIAVSEARKLGIPVIAILDTNCDPDEVTYPIPGNDDAIRSVSLLTRVVADAVADGLIARAGAANGEDKPAASAGSGELGAEEPLAEWERELLEHAAGSAPEATGEQAAATPEATAGEAEAATAGEAEAPTAGEAEAATAGEAEAPTAGEAEAPTAGEAEAPTAGEAEATAEGGSADAAGSGGTGDGAQGAAANGTQQAAANGTPSAG
jgi:small subunit ribosomal protein S2